MGVVVSVTPWDLHVPFYSLASVNLQSALCPSQAARSQIGAYFIYLVTMSTSCVLEQQWRKTSTVIKKKRVPNRLFHVGIYTKMCAVQVFATRWLKWLCGIYQSQPWIRLCHWNGPSTVRPKVSTHTIRPNKTGSIY